MSGQLPRVNSFYPHDAGHPKILIQGLLGPPVTWMLAPFSDDNPFSPDSSGLVVFFRHSVIADVGARHGDDLTFIGRIRQNFLVARHGDMEHDLPHRLTFEAERAPLEDSAVCQCEDSFLSHLSIL